MLSKHWGKILMIVVLVAIAGFTWYANQTTTQTNEGVVIEPNVKGNPDAAVTLVKYSDFQCPACAQAAPVVDAVLEQYGEQVRFEYRHFPLVTIHPLAIPAARAAEAAGQQGAFWEMHDLLFTNQSQWSTGGNPTAAFLSYAAELGLDEEMFRRHLRASMIDEHIQQQFAEARETGLTGTPSFLLNGERMEFNSYEEFQQQIEAAIGANGETEAPATAAEAGLELDI